MEKINSLASNLERKKVSNRAKVAKVAHKEALKAIPITQQKILIVECPEIQAQREAASPKNSIEPWKPTIGVPSKKPPNHPHQFKSSNY